MGAPLEPDAAKRNGGVKPAKRQHFLARFYLRNFAEPMFSDNLCVYDVREARWHRRTTAGVGWFPHLPWAPPSRKLSAPR
jgi:hypothetical protein